MIVIAVNMLNLKDFIVFDPGISILWICHQERERPKMYASGCFFEEMAII